MSVERLVGILEHLAGRREGSSLAELSRAISAPKTSLIGLLSGLQKVQYVRRERDRYVLGAGAARFAFSVMPQRDVIAIARPKLEQVVRETGETGLIAELAPDGETTIYTDKCESTNPVRYTVPVGDRRDLYCSAVGKCFLAFSFTAEQVDAYLARRTLKPWTRHTITRPNELRGELRRILDAGLAETKEERVLGVHGLAAPIFTAEGTMSLALAIGGPSERVRKNRRAYVEALLRTAGEISNLLRGVDR